MIEDYKIKEGIVKIIHIGHRNRAESKTGMVLSLLGSNILTASEISHSTGYNRKSIASCLGRMVRNKEVVEFFSDQDRFAHFTSYQNALKIGIIKKQ